MIRDKLSTFAAAVSVAAAAGTAIIGDVYDTAGRAPTAVSGIFDSEDLFLVIRPTTSIITGGGAGTVTFQFVSSASSTITSSPNVHYATRALVTGATAAVGTGLAANDVTACLQIPRGSGVVPIYLRFIGILCVTATTTTTAGAINAFLTKDVGFWTPLPQATQ